MPATFGWTEIEDIVLGLDEAHPDVDALSVRFTELRKMVEALDDFEAEPGHNVNEQILEAIQAGWHEERQEQAALGRDELGKKLGEDSGDDPEDGRSYEPNQPFR
jgi:FeS assembly protein IscX